MLPASLWQIISHLRSHFGHLPRLSKTHIRAPLSLSTGMYDIFISFQVEWMDNAPYPLLWFTFELPDNFYCLGCRRTTKCDSSRRFDLQAVWKEMVSVVFGWLDLTTADHRTLRRGKHRLLLWPGVESDGSIETTTPSKLAVQDEMGRLEKASALRFPISAIYNGL
jgi:hypothetical protein